MARTPIIAGNWKLNKGTSAEATTLIAELLPLVTGKTGVDVVVCPPYTSLAAVQTALASAEK